MIANIVHISLNPRGGSERLAVAVIQALSEIGIDIDLTTFEEPNISKLESAYGEIATSAIKKIKRITITDSIGVAEINKHYDLTINTHGDMLPYFLPYFSKNNSITYCHFPLAKYLIESEDPEYCRFLNGRILSSINHTNQSTKYYDFVNMAYANMLRSSTVISNSEFSRRVILRAFGIDSIVLSPPVDVTLFRKAALFSSHARNNKDAILVISRFHPTKKIENAIKLAKLLKQYKVGTEMKIVGNIPPKRDGYYLYLKHLVERYNLADYVTFEVNVSFSRLLNLMRESKVYFHPLLGEPFGISTVEAMSAGLIPVVPNIGGHTEFVPLKYQFHTFGEGVKAISSALNAPNSERMLISDSVRRYSIDSFIHHFQQIVTNLTTRKIKV
ncbi:MAG TPA: glycosyltransferase family 4 protein [Nitrososphaeraceae archaeon]|nr:glycosyltransferase family 4 protein [Nitrososphaeraceae archaeon]